MSIEHKAGLSDNTLVRELVASALAVPESRRAGYLEEACAGDQVLRAEVEPEQSFRELMSMS